MDILMLIGYLIPEFPTQTHNFFWNERTALHGLGIETCLISTRRPNEALVSHAWARTAQANTTYLAEISFQEALGTFIELMKLGPRAWFRAIKASTDGCPSRQICYNLALILAAMRLVVLARRQGLAHVHSHSCGRAALIAMIANRLAGISYSLTLHGDMKDYGPQQAVKFRHAAFAIAITRKLRSQIRETLKDDAPTCIGLAPMGVDTAEFKRTAPYRPWSGTDPLRLFSCGRLNFVKGHQDLIRAVGILRDQGMDVVLEIAGEDDMGGVGYRRDLEVLLKDLGLSERVSLLGAVSEKRVLRGLCNSDLFVLASHHEPLGVAIMEALSCGLPVVATNLGGVPELISHGADGHLVSPQNPRVLADAIRRVATDPTMAKAYSDAGRSKIEESFKSDISALELKRLIIAVECSRNSGNWP
jgi:colanic acid/amylovoran biosynthesis glycosyltransferase